MKIRIEMGNTTVAIELNLGRTGYKLETLSGASIGYIEFGVFNLTWYYSHFPRFSKPSE